NADDIHGIIKLGHLLVLEFASRNDQLEVVAGRWTQDVVYSFARVVLVAGPTDSQAAFALVLVVEQPRFKAIRGMVNIPIRGEGGLQPFRGRRDYRRVGKKTFCSLLR